MREYDKLEEVEKRARVVIKSTGKVWVAREWVGVGSDCGSLACLLSNDRTATHRIHVHTLLSVCAYCWLTRAHVPHGWVCCLVGGAGAPPTKKERERERVNGPKRARAATMSGWASAWPQKLSHSTHTTFKYNAKASSASSSNCRRGQKDSKQPQPPHAA